MRHLSYGSVFKAALAFLFTTAFFFPVTAAAYCPFNDGSCIDGLAQVSVSFQFDSISPSPLFFYYAFDGGFSYPNGSSVIKVGYWLHYDQLQITNYNKLSQGTNWTTEAALRIGNLDGYVGGSNNGCDGVWGNTCSENLKSFLQSAIFTLSRSGVPYEMPLQTVLQPLTDNSQNSYIQGCPSTLFQLNDIPSYVVINETNIGGNNQSDNVSVASSGSPSSPWRTWFIQDVTPAQQAKEVAVGIIARGPVYGSKPLQGPEDIQLELICSRAPKQGHFPGAGSSDDHSDHSVKGFARGIIKTYALGDEFDYGGEADDEDYSDDLEFDADDYEDCSEEQA